MTDTDNTIDVAICGAGPVGMALAALLARRGMAGSRIALIDAKSLSAAISDPRSIALSYGSRMLLEEIGAWPIPATAIHDIHISRRGHFGRSMIERSEHDVPALGYVTRYGELVTALSGACERAGITVVRPARVTGHLEHTDGVSLQLDDGSVLDAALVVQAEGGVFGEQDNKALTRDYRQTAVIARVSTSTPIAHRAYERFTDEGPLALLPQDGSDGKQYALVWCVRPETAEQLLQLDDAAFLARLGDAFGTRLGRFTATSSRASYKLGLNANPAATARTVAIGNAAQTLHPVAGQGLNLGLRDAAVLARLLGQGATPEQLAEFTDARQADRRITVGLTDAMARAFAGTGPAQALLGLSLGVFDTVAPARALLAELMMFGRR
ncbi:UbiH/UbiF/VisC/COQ6 family ubiquinone biosynthesis hydroxylase [Massilia sp. CF038]|uniref:UbiH/UbiF/VisC/COQ6 family ubiquinone biosynthesis hydroxylase n=1 Tax=Massilia sp. CF038 TaxID=1881045 RepID=UPI00091E22BA|nr:UbiH/UbiF/VisC/COQ6 family ubiquinone biosynthesis hydroxylase [Massilia sp. CF038]SHH55510.1 2-octaprenyl-6-methoxyphenol hydroxylase [Massilia sp. CF038]